MECLYYLRTNPRPPPPAQVGDRVKVLSGQHAGETGMVLQVKDELCMIISDTTKQEVKVFSR